MLLPFPGPFMLAAAPNEAARKSMISTLRNNQKRKTAIIRKSLQSQRHHNSTITKPFEQFTFLVTSTLFNKSHSFKLFYQMTSVAASKTNCIRNCLWHENEVEYRSPWYLFFYFRSSKLALNMRGYFFCMMEPRQTPNILSSNYNSCLNSIKSVSPFTYWREGDYNPIEIKILFSIIIRFSIITCFLSANLIVSDLSTKIQENKLFSLFPFYLPFQLKNLESIKRNQGNRRMRL